MKKWQKVLIQSGLVLLILVAAVGLAKKMASFRKSPEKKDKNVSAPLLHAMEVLQQTMLMNVQGNGTVTARMQVQVVPQVSGKVIECHRQLVNGGFFKADEPLVVIEKTDYELAVESASAAVAQAQVKMEQEQAEADVSRQEWDRLHPNEEPTSVLVLRGPQIQNAHAQLRAAQAQLAKAKLDLERTSIKMPFDGRIVSTNIDVGQFITAGAVVYRTDLVEITVPLKDSELAWFDVPLAGNGLANAMSRTVVDVTSTFAGKEHTWAGKLVRTEGRIDPKSRMVRVVVQVDDPFKIEGDRPPLVPGMFTRVNIAGRKVKDIYRVPRYAIRKGTEIWVGRKIEEAGKNKDEKKVDDHQAASNANSAESQVYYELEILPVQIIRMDRQSAYISEGLADGDIVILSPLETVTDGMTIRVYMDDDKSDSQEGDL
ncbi:MAG: efflux RND transporter periplasmic adaptor subunit [Planctomycetota bacterium]|jgi:RND family efflux transporter MFP subunit